MQVHPAVLAVTEAATKSNSPANYLPFLVLIALVLFMVRNQRKRAAALRKLSDDLSVGMEVLTRSGQIGRITDLSDTEVSLEIAPGVVSRFVRGAILQPFVPPSADVTDAAAQAESQAKHAHNDDAATENGS